MRIQFRSLQEKILVVELRGKPEQTKANQELEAAWQQALAHGVRQIALDLSNLEFMSGSFYGFIVALWKRSAGLGVELSIMVPIDSMIASVLRTVGAFQVLPSYPSVEMFARQHQKASALV